MGATSKKTKTEKAKAAKKKTKKTTVKKAYAGTFPALPKRGYFKNGDKGEQVKRLQKFLNWYGGYGLKVDGVVGTTTIKAVKKFQKAVKIKQDGKFGKSSLKKAKTVKKTTKVTKTTSKKKTKKKQGTARNAKKVVASAKKKASIKRKKTSAMAKWGDAVFSVSANYPGSKMKVFTFRDMERSYSIRWSEHNILGKGPKLEFQGVDADEITIEVILDAELGVRPRHTMGIFRTAAKKGEKHPFYVKGTKIGSNPFVIKSGVEHWDEIWNKGELVRAKTNITFKEYR